MVQYAKSFKLVMLLTLQSKKTWSLNENQCFKKEIDFQRIQDHENQHFQIQVE